MQKSLGSEREDDLKREAKSEIQYIIYKVLGKGKKIVIKRNRKKQVFCGSLKRG